MRILGLDPGTATTGYGIIEAHDGELRLVTCGVIQTDPAQPMAARLLTIYNQIQELLITYRPDSVGIEELFFGRNITTAISVGQARGVLLLALAQADLPIGEYSPPKIKEAVAGYGNASKAQVQMMVCHLLQLEETPQPDDAADGLATAITHYYQQRYAAWATA